MTEHTPTDDWFNALLRAAQDASDDARLALWQQAVMDHPQSALPYLMLGAEYAHLGANDAAEDAYSRALLAAPSLDIARFQLGLLQLCNQRAAAAVLTLSPLAAAPEGAPLRLFAEGLTALAAGQMAEAIAKLQQGILANDQNPALNTDMQRVIDRINASEPAGNDHHPADYHFLLANYQEAGKLH